MDRILRPFRQAIFWEDHFVVYYKQRSRKNMLYTITCIALALELKESRLCGGAMCHLFARPQKHVHLFWKSGNYRPINFPACIARGRYEVIVRTQRVDWPILHMFQPMKSHHEVF